MGSPPSFFLKKIFRNSLQRRENNFFVKKLMQFKKSEDLFLLQKNDNSPEDIRFLILKRLLFKN